MMRPADEAQSVERRARFESFEQRLALSAEPLGDFFLDLGEALESQYGETAPALADAHELTGVHYAREKFGLEAAEREFFARYDRKSRSNWKRRPSFARVVKGKIEFLGMVRGLDDPIYQRFKAQWQNLIGTLDQAGDENRLE